MLAAKVCAAAMSEVKMRVAIHTRHRGAGVEPRQRHEQTR